MCVCVCVGLEQQQRERRIDEAAARGESDQVIPLRWLLLLAPSASCLLVIRCCDDQMLCLSSESTCVCMYTPTVYFGDQIWSQVRDQRSRKEMGENIVSLVAACSGDGRTAAAAAAAAVTTDENRMITRTIHGSLLAQTEQCERVSLSLSFP